MSPRHILPETSVSAYVKSIFIFENNDPTQSAILPFFADGYPGVVFSVAPNGVFLLPQNKLLSSFFLYGQTLLPIELSIQGTYRLIVFQLFPFAAKVFFNVNVKELNDDCFDLGEIAEKKIGDFGEKLKNTEGVVEQIALLTNLLQMLDNQSNMIIDVRIQQAIHVILQKKGKISIKELRLQLHITERTFERQFLAYVGVTPKHFTKIIQFQVSLNQLSEDNYTRLTDIVFDNGFADQSHFIRNFKQFTGKTPSDFKK